MSLSIKPKQTLVYYDGPIVFLGEDVVGASYVCVLIERAEEADRYLCVPISKEKLHAVVNSKVDLRDVFENPELENYYVANVEIWDDSIPLESIEVAAIAMEWFPLPGTFIKVKHVEEDAKALVTSAVQQNAGVLEYSLNPPEASGETRISTETLIEGLLALQRVIKYSYKNSLSNLSRKVRATLNSGVEDYHTDVIGFAPGSFKVILKSRNPADFTGYVGIEKAFDRLNDILSSDQNPENILAALKENKGHLVSSYISLLQFVIKNKCPITYRFAVPHDATVKRGALGTKMAEDLYQKLSASAEMTAEEIHGIGEFEKVDKPHGTWIIRDPEGKKYSGGLSEKSKKELHSVVVGGKTYSFTLLETLEESEATGKEIKRHVLLDYAPLEGSPENLDEMG